MCALFPAIAQAADWYVVAGAAPASGSGTKADPFSQLSGLAAVVRSGDTVHFSSGVHVVAEPLPVYAQTQWLGGYDAQFGKRDVLATPTVFRGDGTFAFLALSSSSNDVVVEGVVFDTSEQAFSGSCQGCMNPIVSGKPYIELRDAGRATFRHTAFVNAPSGAVSGSISSTLLFDNVVFMNVRPQAVSVTGSCGYATPLCAELVVKHTLVLWAWRATPAIDAAAGDALVVGAGVRADVRESIFAYADGAAIALVGEPRSLAVAQLVVFDNAKGDVWFAADAKATVAKSVLIHELKEGRGVDAVRDPGRMQRLALPWDSAYLDRYLKRSPATFYGARVDVQKAWMMSPLAAVGPQTPAQSAWTYQAAVDGRTAPASVPAVELPSAVDAASAAEKMPAHGKAKTLKGKSKDPSHYGQGRKAKGKRRK